MIASQCTHEYTWYFREGSVISHQSHQLLYFSSSQVHISCPAIWCVFIGAIRCASFCCHRFGLSVWFATKSADDLAKMRERFGKLSDTDLDAYRFVCTQWLG